MFLCSFTLHPILIQVGLLWHFCLLTEFPFLLLHFLPFSRHDFGLIVILTDDSVDNNGQDIPSSGSFSCTEARKLHSGGLSFTQLVKHDSLFFFVLLLDSMNCVHYELARCCIAMSWAKILQMLISLWVKRRYPEKVKKALSSPCWSRFLGVTLLFPCKCCFLGVVFPHYNI